MKKLKRGSIRRILTGILGGVLLVITIWRLFSGITTAPAARWDERVNSSVITNTSDMHSFPVLLHEGIPFYEKPPLWYGTAIVITQLGFPPLFAGRIISVLSALGLIFLCVFFAHRWWGKLAAFATWISLLVSHQLFTRNAGNIFSTHTLISADVDALQLFFILAAVIFCIDMEKKKSVALLCGLSTTGAVLTKGPLGFIPLLTATLLLPYANKDKARAHIALSWIAAVVTILPWYGYMVYTFGQTFISEHFGYHIAERALSGIEGHGRPWMYFFRVITKPGVFPLWPISVFFIFWLPMKKFFLDKKIFFIWSLSCAFLIVPSMMETKLAWYILPWYIFAALSLGSGIVHLVHLVKKKL